MTVTSSKSESLLFVLSLLAVLAVAAEELAFVEVAVNAAVFEFDEADYLVAAALVADCYLLEMRLDVLLAAVNDDAAAALVFADYSFFLFEEEVAVVVELFFMADIDGFI